MKYDPAMDWRVRLVRIERLIDERRRASAPPPPPPRAARRACLRLTALVSTLITAARERRRRVYAFIVTTRRGRFRAYADERRGTLLFSARDDRTLSWALAETGAWRR